MVQFSSGRALAMAIVIVPNIRKPDHSKSSHFSGFQMVFGKMVAICPEFKWLGFRSSDAIRNPDHLQPNLF